MIVFLSDNGSLRPEVWRNLSRVAAALQDRIGVRVRPASVLHSNRIPPAALGGERAVIFEEALREERDAGWERFCVLPFFIGPTRAITQYLPRVIDRVLERRERARGTISSAPFIYPGASLDDGLLLDLLERRTRGIIEQECEHQPPVILVDHGSPEPAVTAVRDKLAERLSERVRDVAPVVIPASMERRAGAEYDFNEPLLATALRRKPCASGTVVLIPLFLAPGRHAGAGGDIPVICSAAEAENPELRIARADLLGVGDTIVEILAARFQMWREGNRICL